MFSEFSNVVKQFLSESREQSEISLVLAYFAMIGLENSRHLFD